MIIIIVLCLEELCVEELVEESFINTDCNDENPSLIVNEADKSSNIYT